MGLTEQRVRASDCSMVCRLEYGRFWSSLPGLATPGLVLQAGDLVVDLL
jgi:hypothetical protein